MSDDTTPDEIDRTADVPGGDDERDILTTTGAEARRSSFGPGGSAGMPAEKTANFGPPVKRLGELLGGPVTFADDCVGEPAAAAAAPQRAACTAPTPLSATGPNVLLVGDSISMGGSGYSLFVRDGLLVHDLNIGGSHQVVTSDRPIPPSARSLGFRMERQGDGPFPHGIGTLLIDGKPAGQMETDQIFWLMISWSGLDIGFDRGTTVTDYDGSGTFMTPFPYSIDVEAPLAEAHAFLRGRGYVTPQDVKSIGMDVLRHRITLTYEAEAEEKTSEDIVQRLFDELPVP